MHGISMIYLPGDQNAIPDYMNRSIFEEDWNLCVNFSVADINTDC